MPGVLSPLDYYWRLINQANVFPRCQLWPDLTCLRTLHCHLYLCRFHLGDRASVAMLFPLFGPGIIPPTRWHPHPHLTPPRSQSTWWLLPPHSYTGYLCPAKLFLYYSLSRDFTGKSLYRSRWPPTLGSSLNIGLCNGMGCLVDFLLLCDQWDVVPWFWRQRILEQWTRRCVFLTCGMNSLMGWSETKFSVET